MHADAAAARRRPSMSDVAEAAGVSKGAVSKVIRNAYGVSDSMRERVEKAIQELGYRPSIAARAMRGSSFSIGLEIPNLGNDFLTQVMLGATNRLAGSSYQLIVAPGIGELSGTPVLENLVDRQVDGLIAVSPSVTCEWLETLAAEMPVVLIGRHDSSAHYDTVTNDDTAGVVLAMNHLNDLGHDRIAHITIRMGEGPENVGTPHALRLEAYEQCTRAAGIEPIVRFCDGSPEDAYLAAKDLLAGDSSITAVLAGHDTLALETQRALADLGRSSHDVSIVGYDDVPISSHPLVSLTTVSQFGERVGATAISLLMERISGSRSEARHYQVQPELRVRSSTRRAAIGEARGARVVTADLSRDSR